MAAWVVMTSTAKMPSSCWGRYRNIILVKVEDPENPPPRADRRIKAILQMHHLGPYHVGLTDRDAYTKAYRSAVERAAKLNAQEGK